MRCELVTKDLICRTRVQGKLNNCIRGRYYSCKNLSLYQGEKKLSQHKTKCSRITNHIHNVRNILYQRVILRNMEHAAMFKVATQRFHCVRCYTIANGNHKEPTGECSPARFFYDVTRIVFLSVQENNSHFFDGLFDMFFPWETSSPEYSEQPSQSIVRLSFNALKKRLLVLEILYTSV